MLGTIAGRSHTCVFRINREYLPDAEVELRHILILHLHTDILIYIRGQSEMSLYRTSTHSK